MIYSQSTCSYDFSAMQNNTADSTYYTDTRHALGTHTAVHAFVVLPTKNLALLLLSGVPTGTSLLPFPLPLPLESNPLSHSAYCTTFSIPVLVLFSVFVGLCFLSSTLPSVSRSPRSARFLVVISEGRICVFAFSRMIWPSVWRVLKSEDGDGLAVERSALYRSPRVRAEESWGSGIRDPVS